MSRPSVPKVRPGRIVTAVWLLIAWFGLTGSYTTASLVGGVVVVAVLMVLFPHSDSRGEHRVRPLHLLRYIWYFGSRLALANVHVARAVVRPDRIRHRRGVIAVPLPRSSRLVQAILSNAVSLTPGTSIIEVSEEPPSLHVHVLELDGVDEIRSSVAELHWRLVAALGPEEREDEVVQHAQELRDRVERGGGTK